MDDCPQTHVNAFIQIHTHAKFHTGEFFCCCLLLLKKIGFKKKKKNLSLMNRKKRDDIHMTFTIKNCRVVVVLFRNNNNNKREFKKYTHIAGRQRVCVRGGAI